MPDEIAALLRDAHGFEQVAVGERLEGGYANDLWRIRGDGATYVLRIKHPPIDEPDIGWEHRLAGWLSKRLSVVVAPIDGVPELEKWAATIADARAWAISFVESVARERALPASVIHGDYFPGNVLVGGDELAGIVDWEKAQVDWVT
jgi:aminoglycoside phosphotransferase (APT) family kinase protein